MAESNRKTIIIEDIVSLYDTFLARFGFFRKFISLLITMHQDNVENIGKLSVLAKIVETISKEVEELKLQIEAMNEKIHASEGTNTKNFTRTSPSDIMDRQYELHNDKS